MNKIYEAAVFRPRTAGSIGLSFLREGKHEIRPTIAPVFCHGYILAITEPKQSEQIRQKLQF